MMNNLNFNGTNPDYLFYTLEKKINLGVFHTKDELINEINRLNDFYKSNGMDLSYYTDKIEKLLKSFDQKYPNNNLNNPKDHEFSNSKIVTPSNENVQNYLGLLKLLVKNYGNMDEILDRYNIPENQRPVYKKMAGEEYKKIREEHEMNRENKPKIYEYQNKEGRNGFVNAFLITIITTLFGSLCLAYMIFSIANM